MRYLLVLVTFSSWLLLERVTYVKYLILVVTIARLGGYSLDQSSFQCSTCPVSVVESLPNGKPTYIAVCVALSGFLMLKWQDLSVIFELLSTDSQ
jgi:hypothetical protein